MKRLFIALPLNKTVQNSIRYVYDKLTEHQSVLKNVSPENYHITLKFLGKVDDNQYNNIVKGFKSLKVNSPSVPIMIKGIGAFPKLSRANIIWFGITGDNTALSGLHEIIDNFTSEYGFEKEKRTFKPHLTIARVRKGKVIPAQLTDYIKKNSETEFAYTSFDRIVLFESKLKKDGPEYYEVCCLDLK